VFTSAYRLVEFILTSASRLSVRAEEDYDDLLMTVVTSDAMIAVLSF